MYPLPCLVRTWWYLVLTDTDTRTTRIMLLNQPKELPGRVDPELPQAMGAEEYCSGHMPGGMGTVG
jgi:hypothetical protein